MKFIITRNILQKADKSKAHNIGDTIDIDEKTPEGKDDIRALYAAGAIADFTPENKAIANEVIEESNLLSAKNAQAVIPGRGK